MAGTARQFLRVLVARRAGGGLLSVCPICFDQTGALTTGVWAGAAVLVIVAAAILGAFARFAWRLASRPSDAIHLGNRSRGSS